MISDFRLKFGRAPGLPAEKIVTTPITVFVGPNNSGKSKVLSEIGRHCTVGDRLSTDVILDDITLVGLPLGAATQAIEQLTVLPNPGEAVGVGHVIVAGMGGRQQVPLDSLKEFVQNPATNIPAFCQWFLRYKTLFLDGRRRIDLVNSQGGGDLQAAPQSSLQVL